MLLSRDGVGGSNRAQWRCQPFENLIQKAKVVANIGECAHLYEQVQSRQRRIVLSGELPSPLAPPSGCVFHTRCPYVEARCTSEIPQFLTQDKGTRVACHGVEEGRLRNLGGESDHAASRRC